MATFPISVLKICLCDVIQAAVDGFRSEWIDQRLPVGIPSCPGLVTIASPTVPTIGSPGPTDLEACTQVVAGLNYNLRFRAPLFCDDGVTEIGRAVLQGTVYSPLSGDAMEFVSGGVLLFEPGDSPVTAAPLAPVCGAEAEREVTVDDLYLPVDDAYGFMSALQAAVDGIRATADISGIKGLPCSAMCPGTAMPSLGDPGTLEACRFGTKYKVRFSAPLLCDGGHGVIGNATVQANVDAPNIGDGPPGPWLLVSVDVLSFVNDNPPAFRIGNDVVGGSVSSTDGSIIAIDNKPDDSGASYAAASLRAAAAALAAVASISAFMISL